MHDQELIAVYRDHAAALYRVVSRRVGGQRALAEDVVQEAFLRALTAWRERGIPERPDAWLHTVAMNLVRNHARGPQPVGDVGERVAAPALVEPSDDADALRTGLEQLSEPSARLLAERHVEGQSLAEIAASRGVTERAVEGRLHRARNALRSVISRPNSQRQNDQD